MAELPSHDGENFDRSQADRDIDTFIEGTANLEGPSVQVLADQVAKFMMAAWEAIERDTKTVPNNKLIATMLLVSRQAREVPPEDPRHWQLHAGSTILSGLLSHPGPSI